MEIKLKFVEYEAQTLRRGLNSSDSNHAQETTKKSNSYKKYLRAFKGTSREFPAKLNIDKGRLSSRNIIEVFC